LAFRALHHEIGRVDEWLGISLPSTAIVNFCVMILLYYEIMVTRELTLGLNEFKLLFTLQGEDKIILTIDHYNNF